MRIYEKELKFNKPKNNDNLLDFIREKITSELPESCHPLKIAITDSHGANINSEIGVIELCDSESHKFSSIFDFNERQIENTSQFNTVLVIPTGIGSEIGGHAGDATPVAKLLGSVSDKLFTHPNVVNASDINEMPENTLYVEGSVLSRFLMGTIGLSEVRSNRILAVVEKHQDDLFTNAACNAINAARASCGLECPRIIQLDSNLDLSSDYSESGRAVGQLENISTLVDVLEKYESDYDVVALSTIVRVPREYHSMYFGSNGNMINAWGGPEAIFTHTLSSLFNIQTAHSPMLEDQLIANFDPGVVDPRMAAEAVSFTFLQCILKGLNRAPKIVTDKNLMNHHGVYTASDVSCMVIPDGIIGLPTLAALEQGIKVIAVRENRNLMKNDLESLPWVRGQFHIVDNYLEAAGVINALKSGIAPESIRRPLNIADMGTNYDDTKTSEANQEKESSRKIN